MYGRSSVDVQTLALPVMMAAVLGFSFAPLAIVVGGGANSPFLVNLLWRVGLAAGYFVYLAAFCRSLVRSPEFWSRFARRILMLRRGCNWRRISYLAVLGNFDIALFGLSTKFTDVKVAGGPGMSRVLFHRCPASVAMATMDRSCADAASKSMVACSARLIQTLTCIWAKLASGL